MKKILKAIPLLSSAAVLSAPTIALTSCSENYYEEFTYTFDNDEHKPENFLPSEEKSKLTQATQQQALDDFFSACSNNKKILADQLVYQFINASWLTPVLSFTGTIKAEIGKIDKENYAFSYRLNVDVFDYSNNEYKCVVAATNVRYLVLYTGNMWKCLNWNEYMQVLGVDMYLQALILASNRYRWRVELDMNENSTQKFLKSQGQQWDIPYVGPLYISVDSNDYPDDRRYIDIYGIQKFLYGNTIVQTYYLRDVQHIEE